MTIYIVQGRYSQQGLKGLVDRPEDRQAEVKALVERHGGRLLGYYVTLGEYDWMTISEGADPVSLLSSLAVAGSTGAFTDMKTTIGYTSADAKKAFDMAHVASSQFRAPGAA